MSWVLAEFKESLFEDIQELRSFQSSSILLARRSWLEGGPWTYSWTSSAQIWPSVRSTIHPFYNQPSILGLDKMKNILQRSFFTLSPLQLISDIPRMNSGNTNKKKQYLPIRYFWGFVTFEGSSHVMAPNAEEFLALRVWQPLVLRDPRCWEVPRFCIVLFLRGPLLPRVSPFLAFEGSPFWYISHAPLTLQSGASGPFAHLSHIYHNLNNSCTCMF